MSKIAVCVGYAVAFAAGAWGLTDMPSGPYRGGFVLISLAGIAGYVGMWMICGVILLFVTILATVVTIFCGIFWEILCKGLGALIWFVLKTFCSPMVPPLIAVRAAWQRATAKIAVFTRMLRLDHC